MLSVCERKRKREGCVRERGKEGCVDLRDTPPVYPKHSHTYTVHPINTLGPKLTLHSDKCLNLQLSCSAMHSH